MIQAIGAGIGDEQDITKRRYGKIIIMTDAGRGRFHIRTLLLCFFYRQMYELVAKGHVYVAQPPLFRVRMARKRAISKPKREMKSQLLERGLGEATLEDGEGMSVNTEQMRQLCNVLAAMEDSLIALERRRHQPKVPRRAPRPVTLKLPVFHVYGWSHRTLAHHSERA